MIRFDSPKLARRALRNTFYVLCLVGLLSIAFFFWFSSWLFKIPAFGAVVFAWYLLYRMDVALATIRAKRARGPVLDLP